MKPKATSESLSFRLTPPLMKLLEQRADDERISRGEMARKLLTEALTDARADECRLCMDKLADGLLRLREDLATAVAALLTRDGPVAVEEAKGWVRKNFLESCGKE